MKKNAHETDRALSEPTGAKKVRGFKYNRSRFQAKKGRGNDSTENEDYRPKNNCLRTELVSKKLHTQLSVDAFDMVGSEASDQTRESTTCLCVTLRDRHGHVKKFVFHDGENLLAQDMRKKANELNDDVIQAEQSHAEGQLIQFSLLRNQVRPSWYTHIIGMGCSTCHCTECNSLLKLFLGEGYHGATALVDDKKDSGNGPKSGPILATSEPKDSYEADNFNDDVGHTQSIVQTMAHKVVRGEKTIDTAPYTNCYLPENLQQEIRHRTDSNLDLYDKRFNKSKNKEQKTKRGRKPDYSTLCYYHGARIHRMSATYFA